MLNDCSCVKWVRSSSLKELSSVFSYLRWGTGVRSTETNLFLLSLRVKRLGTGRKFTEESKLSFRLNIVKLPKLLRSTEVSLLLERRSKFILGRYLIWEIFSVEHPLMLNSVRVGGSSSSCSWVILGNLFPLK